MTRIVASTDQRRERLCQEIARLPRPIERTQNTRLRGNETEKRVRDFARQASTFDFGSSLPRSASLAATRGLLNTMETISDAGAKFQSLSEPWANTTTHVGKMIMTIFAGIAEFERDLIRERTGAGRQAAKKRGVCFGRPRKLSPDQRKSAEQLLMGGKPVKEVARTFDVHESTIYRLAANLEKFPE